VRGAGRFHRCAQSFSGNQPRRAAARLAGDDVESASRVQRAPGHRNRRPADIAHALQLGVRSRLHGRHIPTGVRGTPVPDGAGSVRRQGRVAGDGRRKYRLFGRSRRTGDGRVAAARPRDDGGAQRAPGQRVAGAEGVHHVRVQHHLPNVPAVLPVPVGGAQETGDQ